MEIKFSLSQEEKESLTSYRLLYWSAGYFLSKLEQGHGALILDSKRYSVLYSRCNLYSLEALAHYHSQQQVKLSFRESNTSCYVIVAIAAS